MIHGGEHMEWPREDYFYDTAYEEAEMEEYEEAMWEQVLKDGPPQDDDISWIKQRVWFLALKAAKSEADFEAMLNSMAWQ